MTKQVTVLTLNIWNRSGPYAERLKLLRAAIADLQPDLIGLQEVVGHEQMQELLSDTEYHSDYFGARYEGSEMGIGIAARWPLRARQELNLPGDVDSATGGQALRVMVDSPYGPIPFTCLQIAFYAAHHGFKREQQMPAINEFARGRTKQDFPAILVGDFNTDPESTEIRYLKGWQSLMSSSAYWCDAWDHAGNQSKGATWSRSNPYAAWAPWPNRRIDYLFVAQPRLDQVGTIEHCEVVCNKPVEGIWPSDHFGVFAKLRASKD